MGTPKTMYQYWVKSSLTLMTNSVGAGKSAPNEENTCLNDGMTKINEMKPMLKETAPLLVAEAKNGTTNKGEPYLNMTLQDNTGTINGKFWKVTEEDQQQIGDACRLRLVRDALFDEDLLLS